MTPKQILCACLASAVAGAAITRVYASREVIKTVVEQHETIKDNVVTVTKTVYKDGKPASSTAVTTDRTKTDVVTESRREDDKAATSPLWHVSAGYTTDGQYLGAVERRILGPVSVGVTGRSDRTFGVIVGFDF